MEKKVKKTEEEEIQFKGKFIKAIGRRKTAVAQIRLYKNGTGAILVNGLKITQYFHKNLIGFIHQALKLAGHSRDLNFSIKVMGGGKKAQAGAVLLGIARSLVMIDKELQPMIKAKNWLTRDSRKKERKKPGLKKARRAPQWAKR